MTTTPAKPVKACTTIVLAILLISCNNTKDSLQPLPLEGTWELLSETRIEKNDTIFTPASNAQRMIKVINPTHFAFLRHDLRQGKDSTALFVAGGGRYSLNDREYTEHLEYCNFREWENHTFKFTVDIRNDTLVQQGREKIEGTDIDRIILEKYRRVRE